MISGDLGYVGKERGCRENAESDDQIPGKQTLESLNPGPLGPFLPTNWEKNHKSYEGVIY